MRRASQLLQGGSQRRALQTSPELPIPSASAVSKAPTTEHPAAGTQLPPGTDKVNLKAQVRCLQPLQDRADHLLLNQDVYMKLHQELFS